MLQKLVYIGNQIDLLRYIHQNFELDFCFIEDAPRNKEALDYCKNNNIKHVICRTSKDLYEYCIQNNIKIDLCISCYLGIILKEGFISQCNKIINIHTGDLTSNRGPQPLYHNVINSDPIATITAHTISNCQIDAGNIIDEVRIPINYESDFMKLVHDSYTSFESAIKNIIQNHYSKSLIEREFDINKSKYRPMVPKEIKDIILKAKSLNDAKSELAKLDLRYLTI